MAYNREWDKGKDSWNDPNKWSAQDQRGNIRAREDDNNGEGKRRKFNNGGYDSARNNDDSAQGYSHNRQNEWSQDYGQEDRSRGGGGLGGFAKKRLVPSEPSPHVIFLGLDPDFTEADLQAYLVSNGCSVETVTIIREKSSGSSKGFGFAQFTTVEHARAFVDPLFPFIQMPPPASHGASATAAFYKALETGIPHNGRRVKIDYSQSATPHDKGRLNRGNMNDGTRDIGNSQSPILLFRGLDPLSGPQAIYQAMLSSSGSTTDGAKGMRRIILIKDKVTMASFGFAFVEFVDTQSAATVLAATMSSQIHPNGFRISDRPVAASFAHPYSFQPVTDFLQRDEACLASTMTLGGVEGTWVKYWDESSTVAVLEFKVEEPIQPTGQTKDKKEKKKAKSEADVVPKAPPVAPSVLPVLDKLVTLSFSKGPVKLSTVSNPTKLPVPGFSMDDSSNADGVQEDTGSDPNKPLVVKRVAPLIASKKTVNNINKWNQVQEDLAHDITPSSTTLTAPSKTLSKATATNKTSTGLILETSPKPEADYEFSDIPGLMCLLCARQFKTLEQLTLHNKKSDLHKKNYKDTNLRDVAREKVTARSAGTAPEQPKYRDRASERRVLFNQPDAPLPEKDPTIKKRHVEGPPRPATPPPPVNPGKDEGNVGNKLLKMMGWKEGTGLGSEGDGRVDPIETAIYAQGAGLGASKGRDIGKYTEGFSSYVHMAQDAARERYSG
ncbi:hypothetical protein B0H34DRAFT_693746 [Crassisporium funariophilum]|nr:hypothetical protein B0H34DRAFT_693746 [Crassisporium funariophilum]